MSAGTTRQLPLGITTDDRWGASRRRRILMTICSMCAVAAVSFLIAEKAHDVIVSRSATAPVAATSPVAGRAWRGAGAVTEAPRAPAEPAEVVIPGPISPSAAAASTKPPSEPEPPTVPAVAPPEPPGPPTVLRGASIRPR